MQVPNLDISPYVFAKPIDDISLDIVAIHGAWQDPITFQALGAEFGKARHRFIAPRLPIEDPDKTYKTYGYGIAEAIEAAGFHRPHIIGHSLGGLTASAVTELIPIESITYICGIIPATKSDQAALDEFEWLTPKQSDEFKNAIVTYGDVTRINPSKAEAMFFGDCMPIVARAAAATLRAHRLREPDIVLDKRPDVREASIIATEDKVLNPVWQLGRTMLLLDQIATSIDSDHSPHVSHPKQLAAMLLAQMKQAT